ncbi:SOS response-associated peptidase [Alkalihalophilus marmarensis]|uniref:SOS response-associated peptidase n=1 Tax=Alkalihalophilus marmarensis TaxID=521377 RepID=UPI002DB827A2|nr:SOS response-associated peptidase [Alkalihalophilus marmarensis]MEC2072160.1 SOS response-associated peptidase [Alkalihalophilus marmarensis]
MCGRFSLFSGRKQLQEEFKFMNDVPSDYSARYNIAPQSQILSIIQGENGDRRIVYLRWGLIPRWAKDEKVGYKMINARGETVDEKPSFKQPFKQKRCLIPCSGFYEWKRDGNNKVPYFISLKNRQLFGLAALWEKYVDEKNNAIYSCTILTTKPNKLMAGLHDRMPVILKQQDYSTWLSPESDLAKVKPLLSPYQSDPMMADQVSTIVNNPRNDEAECVKPIN